MPTLRMLAEAFFITWVFMGVIIAWCSFMKAHSSPDEYEALDEYSSFAQTLAMLAIVAFWPFLMDTLFKKDEDA